MKRQVWFKLAPSIQTQLTSYILNGFTTITTISDMLTIFLKLLLLANNKSEMLL